MRGHAGIIEVGGTSNVPGGGSADINSTTTGTRIEGMTDWQRGTIYVQYNDDKFLDAVSLDLIAGRDFDRNRKADTAVMVVNEAFVHRLGIADAGEALGQILQFEGGDSRYEIIGVISNFNRTSLKLSVEPTLYFPWMSPNASVVKLNPDRYREGLAFLEGKWSQFFPTTPLDYVFLDDRFQRLYEQDKRFGRVSVVFAILAIAIASLGLFGLSAFMAVQKTKEVGVRKVLGASIPGIVSLFYRDFAKLIGIAALVGIPAVYYVMNNLWLQNYAFRIAFPWYVVIVALVLVSLFSLLIVGYQIYRVAILNPAETLHYE